MTAAFSKPPDPMPRALGFVRWFVGNVPHMLRSDTPRFVWTPYLRTFVRRPRLERYADDKRRFQDTMSGARVSHDWFTGYIPYWLAAFHRYGLFDRPVRALEIGSWEECRAASSSTRYPKRISPVWTPGLAPTSTAVSSCGGSRTTSTPTWRCTKDASRRSKSTSFEFFSAQTQRGQFDLVYVDGSHYCDDAIVDAIKGSTNSRWAAS